MANKLIPALHERRRDFRAGIQDQPIHIMRTRQAVFIKHGQHVPKPDAIAVIPPGIIALGLRRGGAGTVAAKPSAKGEGFDIVAQHHRQPRPIGPFIGWALRNGAMLIAPMGGQFHGWSPLTVRDAKAAAGLRQSSQPPLQGHPAMRYSSPENWRNGVCQMAAQRIGSPIRHRSATR